jgi:hypothetical protein
MVTPRQSLSSSQPVPVRDKILESWALLVHSLSGRTATVKLELLFEFLAEYDAELRKYANTTLADATILDIGFGARPYRLMAMTGLGFDAIGVDVDQPSLHRGGRELVSIYKRNGFERMLKTLVRSTLVDARERRAVEREIEARGGRLVIDDDRFLVMDAASARFDDLMRTRPVDLIVSEDVFEHMPVTSLRAVVSAMGDWLTPRGLALIRPNIYTGITGGHLVEWYPPLETRSRRKSEPWEHLRKNRFVANTFLNRLTRSDYRELFSAHFDILDERVLRPDLGRVYATPDVRADLCQFPDDELFSNHVLFVLRSRRAE